MWEIQHCCWECLQDHQKFGTFSENFKNADILALNNLTSNCLFFFFMIYNVCPVIYKAADCVRVKTRKSEYFLKGKWLMVTSMHQLKVTNEIFTAEQNEVAK